MTELEALARKVGSRRYARDLLEEAKGGPRVLAKPWWDMPGEEPRPMTGFFASLTEDQKKTALAYRGEEGHGDANLSSKLRKPIFAPDCWPFK